MESSVIPEAPITAGALPVIWVANAAMLYRQGAGRTALTKKSQQDLKREATGIRHHNEGVANGRQELSLEEKPKGRLWRG